MSSSTVCSRSYLFCSFLHRASLAGRSRRGLATALSRQGRKRGQGKTRRFLKWSGAAVVVITGGTYLWGKVSNRPYMLPEGKKRKKVVILGSGWGAVSVLNHLTPGQFEVTVVSPRNYFLFTPLLPSITVGTVESRSIVEPIRKLIYKHHKDVPITFLEADCTAIDPVQKQVKCEDCSAIVGEVSKWDLPYDILVVAVGATTNNMSVPGVEKHCHYLKEISDAQSIRNTLIDLVETASIPGQTEAERKRLLHFVVVGGGPTGVEFAAELQDFLHDDVSHIYPGVKEDACVTVIQSTDHILNTYDQTISQYTENQFESDSINVVTNARVAEVKKDSLVIMDKKTREKKEVPYGLCVWSTGVAPTSLAKNFMAAIPHQGKGRAILTDKYLRVKGAEGVFALGDCSTIEQDQMISQAKELFKEADINGDGTLCMDEFRSVLENAKHKFPQIQVQLSYVENNIEMLFASTDTSGDQKVDYNEFVEILMKMDRNLKNLPATAQVASQQGKYVGKLLCSSDGEVLSQTVHELEGARVSPFKYQHLGSFAYVGNNKAVLQLPLLGSMSGWWTMWLWRAAYANECASSRTKLLVIGDWGKTRVFGRDSSRI